MKAAVVATTVALALANAQSVQAQVPAYDSGSYFHGRCADVNAFWFSGYWTYMRGRTKQEALDACFETFGDGVEAFSWEPTYGSFTCYFTTDEFARLYALPTPTGWTSELVDQTTGPVVRGSEDLFGSTCYAFRLPSQCSARVLAVVDSTFATRYPTPAIEKAVDAFRGAAFAALKMPFSQDVNFGILGLERTALNWHVKLDSPTANVPGDLVAEIFSLFGDLNAGNRAYGTKFPPVFKGVADKLASSEVPSFMLLFTDGQILKPQNVNNYVRLKAEMIERLGSTAPRVICIRLFETENTPFLDAVCDSTYSVDDFPDADDYYYNYFYNSAYDQDRAVANALAQEMCGGNIVNGGVF
ncbi:Hypothetical Protein FCC1311_051772 [Hondaea fermentalgiana]|uniref:VWFA domain-containing protein n=1 Tax=Hondaea fermentalgiana TaxID=2315210 RepID=A0A2R5GDC3_9STRA|nr:Hypothetical Protein FCC1311_051772 [Hondaea fermentalgiana]|eukprot:GBG28956.1 Hypothetical Protein FCC1311_051772 [Hondaea fermentalgiana]